MAFDPVPVISTVAPLSIIIVELFFSLISIALLAPSNDIEAAKAANIKSIAVAGGYTHKDVNKLGATHTLENMKDIIKLLA